MSPDLAGSFGRVRLLAVLDSVSFSGVEYLVEVVVHQYF